MKEGMQFEKNGASSNAVLWPIEWVCKALTRSETHYISIKRNPRHPPWPKKFHHYYCAHKVSMKTDHKPLVAILKEHVAILSHKLLNPSIQHMNTVQAWATIIHCRFSYPHNGADGWTLSCSLYMFKIIPLEKEQIYGRAMVSPTSPIVASLFMEVRNQGHQHC